MIRFLIIFLNTLNPYCIMGYRKNIAFFDNVFEDKNVEKML